MIVIKFQVVSLRKNEWNYSYSQNEEQSRWLFKNDDEENNWKIEEIVDR